ncbi:MAG: hypothetical protein R3F23_01455 [Verrucomicrobiia bacterium]
MNTIFPFNQAPTTTRTEIGGITYDSQGNMLVTGTALGATMFQFETGSDKKKLSFQNPMQAFVAKYNRAGKLLWLKTWTHVGDLGLTPTIRAQAIILNASDEIFITGNFSRIVDFDPGAGVYSLSTIKENAYDDNDLFLLKLNQDGNFLWVKTASAGKDFVNLIPNDITLDKQNNIIITGLQGDIKDPNLINHTFIKKFNSQGNTLWTKTIFANASIDNTIKRTVIAEALTVDSNNNIYLGGNFRSTADFDPGNGKFELKSTGYDGFLCRLSANGDFIWLKRIGGSGDDAIKSITIDKNYKLLIGGEFSGSVDFNPALGTDLRTASGFKDAFLSQFSLNGAYNWTKTFGGPQSTTAIYDLAVDKQNNILSVSISAPVFANSTKIDLDPDLINTSYFTIKSPYLFTSKFSNNGTYIWGRGIEVFDTGGVFSPPNIAVDPANFVAFGGTFKGKTDFDPSPSGGSLLLGYNEIPVFCSFAMELNKNGYLMRPAHDISGDHNSEILWQNQTNYAAQIDLMTYDANNNTPKYVIGLPLTPPDATNNWSLFGSGDFNSDAQPDIVWWTSRRIDKKNFWAVSFMNGFQPSSHVIKEVSPVWELACIGDFDGDTQSDILWHNRDTHQYQINYMNNLNISLTQQLLDSLPANQFVKACGDFDRDGYTDLVVQNQDTGDVYIHFLENYKLKNTSNNPALLKNVSLNPVWEAAGSGDFNQDGHDDLVFQLNFLPNTRAIDFVKTNTVTKASALITQLPWVWKIHNR